MRLAVGAIVGLALVAALAGCTKQAESPPATTTVTPSVSSTPTSSPTPSPTTSSTPPETPSPPANETPPTPTPTPPANETRSVYYQNVTHDYSTQDQNVTIRVPVDQGTMYVIVRFYAGATPAGTWACAGSLHLQLIDPKGAKVTDGFGLQNPNAPDDETECGATYAMPRPTGPIEPGAWHAIFSGPGTGHAFVSVRGVP